MRCLKQDVGFVSLVKGEGATGTGKLDVPSCYKILARKLKGGGHALRSVEKKKERAEKERLYSFRYKTDKNSERGSFGRKSPIRKNKK